jgi:hypothetical protein
MGRQRKTDAKAADNNLLGIEAPKKSSRKSYLENIMDSITVLYLHFRGFIRIVH